jgi:hypothetical protein
VLIAADLDAFDDAYRKTTLTDLAIVNARPPWSADGPGERR